MLKIDLDIELEPLLTVTLGGQEYVVTDIRPQDAMEMSQLTGSDIVKLQELLAKVTGAPAETVGALGLRKTRKLIDAILTAIEEEAKAEAEKAKKGQEVRE
uniref:Tail assembly chaperone n=1 Tax=viral metagenome TaxID=1070528 RepID=A0A6M3KY85_9ZZZZ